MSMAAYEIAGRPGPLQSRSARVALVASLLVHAALIARLPVDFPDFRRSGELETDLPLVVRLAPPFVDPPPAAPPPRVVPRPRPAPPPKAAPAPPAALPTPAVPTGDFSAYIDLRRSVRAALEEPASKSPAAAPEDENARANRIAAANISSARQMTFGFDPSKSGGMFEMKHMSLDYGEFVFTGWNSNVGRRTRQLIEVRRGATSDIRLAIVRKMIAIIREHEPE